MNQLKTCSVELDDRDPFLATFNFHLSRDMQIVDQAETLSGTMEHEQRAVAAQIAERVQGVDERAAAIDWS